MFSALRTEEGLGEELEDGQPTATYYTLDEERRRALANVDNANFSWFHVKVSIVTGVGFFTDAYDIFAISIAAQMLGYLYGGNGSGLSRALTQNQALGVKVATPIGSIFGQLVFGWLADLVGRKRMYGIELMVIIVSTFSQAVAGQAEAVNILGVIVVWRFIMGVGIGGDYPLSAVISSEFASTRNRGRLMTAVFANQGWGQLTSSIVSYIAVVSGKQALLGDSVNNMKSIDYMWRLIIGLGCVPGVIALYFRLTIPETPRFTMDIERNLRQAVLDIDNLLIRDSYWVDPDIAVQRVNAPKRSNRDFFQYFSKWENARQLVGCAYSWFALDIAFYGLILNNNTILTSIPSVTCDNTECVYHELRKICIGNIILSVAGLIPGYWMTFLFIDRWGRKPIQLMGFIVLTALFIIMGFGYEALMKTGPGQKAFIFLYCLANFFWNFGPNTTTFIIPGEAFPTRYRSTAHGISAASGKFGAVISQVGFGLLASKGGAPGSDVYLGHVLEILALFMVTGVFSTLLIKETNQRTLEEISNEDQRGFVRGTVPLAQL